MLFECQWLGAVRSVDAHPEPHPVFHALALERSGEADALLEEVLGREGLHECAEPVGARHQAPQKIGYSFPLIRRFVGERMLVLSGVAACHVPSRHGLPPLWLELLVLSHHAAQLRAGVVQGALDGSLADV
jgi:hypothetical protein